MKLRTPCDEPGCREVGSSHPITQHWVSPKLYCIKHRKGKGTSFLDEAVAIRRFGVGWRAKATERPPSETPYHDHLDVCAQCSNNPFNLCRVGAAAIDAELKSKRNT